MKPPRFHNIDQGEEKWFDLRRGKITASVISMINGVRGIGKTAESLAIRIAYEAMTSFDVERFMTFDTVRGNELEPVAIAAYEDDTSQRVLNGGFFELGDLGVSPDGRVGKDGLVEVKCPRYKNHMKVLKSQTIDPQYIGQVQFQLMVTGRKWCDFISYCEDMPAHKQLFYCRIYPDKEYHKLLKERIESMRELINEYKQILK